MKLPANARALKETAEQAGWRVFVTNEDDGTFMYRHDDDSVQMFHAVPTFQIYISYMNVSMVVGWLRNPVTKRWVISDSKPIIARTRGLDEYPDAITYNLNNALGKNYWYWEWSSVKELTMLLLSDDADMLVHRIQQWGREDTDDDDV